MGNPLYLVLGVRKTFCVPYSPHEIRIQKTIAQKKDCGKDVRQKICQALAGFEDAQGDGVADESEEGGI